MVRGRASYHHCRRIDSRLAGSDQGNHNIRSSVLQQRQVLLGTQGHGTERDKGRVEKERLGGIPPEQGRHNSDRASQGFLRHPRRHRQRQEHPRGTRRARPDQTDPGSAIELS